MLAVVVATSSEQGGDPVGAPSGSGAGVSEDGELGRTAMMACQSMVGGTLGRWQKGSSMLGKMIMVWEKLDGGARLSGSRKKRK